ncbi:MAG: PQQ-dependent sugar dehydrogenase [Burkholderiales bacterium]
MDMSIPAQNPLSFVFALLVGMVPMFAVGLAFSQAPTERIATDEYAVRVVTVARGLEHPWSVAWLPDGRMLVTERPGRLRIVGANGQIAPTPIAGLPPIEPHGQGGLFDVALHPRFAENAFVYFSYAGKGADGFGTELARGKLVGNRLEGVEVLFRQQPKGQTGRHFGGRIVFDRAGFVYLTLGDRGEMARAQKLDDHAGSVIRLHDDGRVPADNPFVGNSAAKPEKYTLGNRNMQGAALNPKSGELWAHEHGPQGGDEVNVIRAGVNYGWPVITYGVNYGIGTKIGEGTHKAGMAHPLHYWVPSIAPSGMVFYDGDKFPRWRGDLFVGALRDQMLVRLQLDGEKIVKEERMLKGVLGRIRDVRQGPDGYLYLLTDESDGVLVRLERVN